MKVPVIIFGVAATYLALVLIMTVVVLLGENKALKATQIPQCKPGQILVVTDSKHVECWGGTQ